MLLEQAMSSKNTSNAVALQMLSVVLSTAYSAPQPAQTQNQLVKTTPDALRYLDSVLLITFQGQVHGSLG